MKEAIAGGGYDDFEYQQHVQNVYQGMQEQSFYQTAVEATTNKWQDIVDGLGQSIGYEWILIAAVIGMPFTIAAILRKMGFLKKEKDNR